MKRLTMLAALALLLIGGAAAGQEIVTVPALETQMNELEEVTRDIRELDGETVARDFPTRDELVEFLEGTLDEDLPAEEAERALNFYLAFDLINAPLDLRTLYQNLLGSQIAGYYDPEIETMHVIPVGGGELGDELGLTEQIIYVHEFTHAMQDQFFDLQAILEGDETLVDNPDRYLAALSVVEGDATLVMTLFTEQLVSENPMLALRLLGEGFQAGAFSLPEGTPQILLRELMFPYESGMMFVSALYNEGGWEAVNAAFDQLPASTEQILNPDKYLAGEQPLAVTLNGGETVLGDGWERIWDATLGEWYLREYLRTQLERAVYVAAAAGWGGDSFHIYRHAENDALALLLRIEWDTQADADEFAAAYAAFGDARYETGALDGCWTGAADALCFAQAGSATLIAQAPTQAAAAALIAAQAE